jgi:transposase
MHWADQKHDVCLSLAGGESELSVLPHRPSCIATWAQGLRERFGGRKIAVCLELSQGPIVSALEPYQLAVESLLSQLRAVVDAIERFDAAIAARATKLPDFDLFKALPGAGPALAPRLLVAFGERRERFPNAAAFQKYVGIAPVTERSGNHSWVHWRFSCPTFVRQTLVEWTEQTIPTSFWAKAFYERHREKGASHNASIRALAFKWIRILWRCWVDRVPYDESRYLSALRKRGSPLLHFAALPSP